jgi:predicted DNA-binding transcriptional regulator YafY
MNRIDRLVAIIVFLQSKRIVRGREIASNFEISLRTVYRDMNALLEAGVPIISEAGEGYSIIEGYHLPPVMFTPEEAKALLTGAKLAEYMTDESLVKHAQSALLKINSVLPLQTKEELERLQDSMRMVRRKNSSSDFRDDVLLTIQNAIISQHVLQMEYYVSSRDEWTKREAEPLGLIHYANHWHLLAWCRKRRDVRDCRNRSKNIKTLRNPSKSKSSLIKK